MSELAWVALGSNVGNRESNLVSALRALQATTGVRVTCVSPFVETAPVGGPPGQGMYLNAAAELETELEPRELLARLLWIESDHGRVRGRGSVRNGPRTLDMDLLLYGRERISEPDLTLPHPRMEERTFVLEPLSHISPDLVLPGCGQRVADRLADLLARPAAEPGDGGARP